MTPRFEQLLAELVRGGEVEVREEQLVLAHQRELGRDRLLDLHDHVGAAPDLFARRDDLRARLDVLLVGDAEPRPAPCSTSTVWPRCTEHRDAGRGHADAKLLGLDLFGNADAHVDGAQYRLAPAEDQRGDVR